MARQIAKRREKIRERDGDLCYYCGKRMRFDRRVTPDGEIIQTGKDATAEHLLDRQYGGTDALDNLVLAHRYCNNSRSYMPPPAKLASRAPHLMRT